MGMQRLSLGLLASAISIASLPAIAQEKGSADDIGVMSISLKDVIKPTFGFQGALQGAGTPNQAGICGFSPLSVGDNSVFFADVLANVNFADYGNDSSIITTVAGTTISTSSRLDYRWLNGDRSWMYGLNAGYFITPVLKASAGCYYQHHDQEDVDGSGVRGRLAYEIRNGLTAGSEYLLRRSIRSQSFSRY